MMDPVKTFKVANKTVNIYIDEDPTSPRNPNFQDNCNTFICFHKRYDLGDKHDYKHEDYSGWAEMKERIIKDLDPLEIRPLYMYDHSGITISSSPFSCPWDSGQIGFVLITKKQAREACMVKKITKKTKEWATKCLDSAIKEYDDYLTGQVYGYVVVDENENELESCWGYIGDIDYVEAEAKSMAEAIVKREQESIMELVS